MIKNYFRYPGVRLNSGRRISGLESHIVSRYS